MSAPRSPHWPDYQWPQKVSIQVSTDGETGVVSTTRSIRRWYEQSLAEIGQSMRNELVAQEPRFVPNLLEQPDFDMWNVYGLPIDSSQLDLAVNDVTAGPISVNRIHPRAWTSFFGLSNNDPRPQARISSGHSAKTTSS